MIYLKVAISNKNNWKSNKNNGKMVSQII